MDNALGQPQTIVLLGATSEIGLAIVDRLVSDSTTTVVLAGRRPDEAPVGRFERAGRTVVAERFDATEHSRHAEVVGSLAERFGDIDVVVVAFGVLGEPATYLRDPAAATAVADVDFTGAVGAIVAAGDVMRRQAHGSIIVVSSVAGERVRPSTAVYGAAKAGLDAFCDGYRDLVRSDGVHVMSVRPGFVRTRMTAGLDEAPFATDADQVADDVVQGWRVRREIVWSPGVLRWMFVVLRHLPRPLWRVVVKRMDR